MNHGAGLVASLAHVLAHRTGAFRLPSQAITPATTNRMGRATLAAAAHGGTGASAERAASTGARARATSPGGHTARNTMLLAAASGKLTRSRVSGGPMTTLAEAA